MGTIIERYRGDWLKREARARGIEPASWEGFTVSTRNVASKKQMGAFILGLVLPLLFVVMVAMGCFYPAVDATAGERERNTWETLMSTAATRVSIVTAKYLYVTTMGGLAGILNLTAMALTMKPIFAPLMAKAGDAFNFSVPFAAIPVMALAALMLAGFVSAGMMIFASFARTFKEGQAMIMPFYLIILLPVMFLQTPGLKFTLPLAFMPDGQRHPDGSRGHCGRFPVAANRRHAGRFRRPHRRVHPAGGVHSAVRRRDAGIV